MIPSAARTDQVTDQALARRAANGERPAQEQLFRRLKTAVRATLYRVLGSNWHMEILTQECFIEVLESLASYRGEAKLTTWTDRIAVRVAFHHLERQSSHEPREAEEPPSLRLVSSPEDDAGHHEEVARVYAAVARKDEVRLTYLAERIEGEPG